MNQLVAPHIFHDAHFPPTGKDRNADRIGNNEKGGNGKHDDEENASQAQDTCQLEEMFHHFLSNLAVSTPGIFSIWGTISWMRSGLSTWTSKE